MYFLHHNIGGGAVRAPTALLIGTKQHSVALLVYLGIRFDRRRKKSVVARDRRLQRNVLSETSSRGVSISDGVLNDESEGGRSSIQLETVARPVADGHVVRSHSQLARP